MENAYYIPSEKRLVSNKILIVLIFSFCVLVNSVAITKISYTGWLKQQIYISHTSEARKFKTRCQHSLVLVERSPPGFLTWLWERAQVSPVPYKVTNSITGVLSPWAQSNLITSQALTCKYQHGEAYGFSIWIWGNTSIQSMNCEYITVKGLNYTKRRAAMLTEWEYGWF